MKVQAFEDFSGGLDTRKPHNIDNKKTLRRLRNAYVTAGDAIRTRPGLRYLGQITGTGNENGLAAYNGRLHIFSTSASGKQTLGGGTEFDAFFVLLPLLLSIDCFLKPAQDGHSYI